MKNTYKITFNYTTFPKSDYFDILEDLETVFEKAYKVTTHRTIKSETPEKAVKILRHKWANNIDIVNIEKEVEYAR